MRHGRIYFWVFAIVLIAVVLASFQYALTQESAEELYQAALFKKNADGDLEGAIKLFNKILKEFPDNRKVCAQAHLQLGMCYEKLGMEKAQKSYQQVIDSYPEQTDAVRVAREKLSTLLSIKKGAEKVDEGLQIRLVEQGGDDSGEISPDNRYLCCVDWETSDLAVMDMASGEMLRLTSHERSELIHLINMKLREALYGPRTQSRLLTLGTVSIPKPVTYVLLGSMTKNHAFFTKAIITRIG